MTRQEAFDKFDLEHPEFWDEFEHRAYVMMTKGRKHYSARTIFEVLRWHSDLDSGGTVQIHADGGTVPIVGVFMGCQYTDPTSGEQVFSAYYPASTNASDIIAFIVDDPNVVFEIQADDTFPIADLFGNFDIVYTNSSSTQSGLSGAELDVTTGATTAGLPLKAIDISEDPDNSDIASANTNVLVVIQNHICGQKGAGLA